MQVGDKIAFIPFVLRYSKDSELKAPSVAAPVIWVHPEGRFAVVERQTGNYSYRECIPCDRITKREVQSSENDCNHEPEGRRR